MHLLPLSLESVARLADRRDSTRFALGAVRLRLNPADGSFVVAATDTKALIQVRGTHRESADDFPTAAIPGLETAPNGHAEALIPAAAWAKAFSGARKLIPARVARQKPVLDGLAVKIGAEVTTFGATDTERNLCESTRNTVGRFPPAEDILADARRKNQFAFAVDPEQLVTVLRTLGDFCDGEVKRVEVFAAGHDKHGSARPILLRAVNGSGLDADALLMPLAGGESGGRSAPAAELPEGTEAEADHLAELASVRKQLADAREQLAAAYRTIDTIQANARTLVEDRDRLQVENARLAARPATTVSLASVPSFSPAPVPAVVPVPSPAPAPGGRPLTRAERIAAMRATPGATPATA